MSILNIYKRIIVIVLFLATALFVLSCSKSEMVSDVVETTYVSPTREVKKEEIVKRNVESSGIVTEQNNDGDIITTVKLANDKLKTIEYDFYDLEDDYNIYVNIQ